MKVSQEFTDPATPEENGHIESFHAIVQAEVTGRREFASKQQTDEVFARWFRFYTNERIHSSIGYTSPNKFLEKYCQKTAD